MNVVLILLHCIAIFLPTSINGLQCYTCDFCSQPFNANNASIITANSTTQSCYKIAVAIATSKGIMDDCVAANAYGIGTWCCNTDLCNAAQLMASMNVKLTISTFLLTIGAAKIRRSY